MSSCIRDGPFNFRSTIFRWRIDALTSSFLDISEVGLKDENLTGNSWSSEIFPIGEKCDRCFLSLQQIFDPSDDHSFGGVRCYLNYLENENQWQKAREFSYQFAGETKDYRVIYSTDFNGYPELIWTAAKLQSLKDLGLTFICCSIRLARQNVAIDWEPMPGLPRSTRLALEVADPKEPPIEFRLNAIGMTKEKLKIRYSKTLVVEGHAFKVEMKTMKIKDTKGFDYYEYTATLNNEGERSADIWSCTAWLEVQRGKWNVRSHKNERVLRPFDDQPSVLWQSTGPADALRKFVGIGDVHLCVTFRAFYSELPTVGPPCIFAKFENQVRKLKITDPAEKKAEEQKGTAPEDSGTESDKFVDETEFELVSNNSGSTDSNNEKKLEKDASKTDVEPKKKCAKSGGSKSIVDPPKRFRFNWNKRLMFNVSSLSEENAEKKTEETNVLEENPDVETEKLQEKFEEMNVDANNNNDKKSEDSIMQESKTETEAEEWTSIELDTQSTDATVEENADNLSKPAASKSTVKFAAIRNVFARLGSKKSTSESEKPEITKLLDYEDFDQEKVEKQIAQVADEFNAVLDDVRVKKQRHWYILEHSDESVIPSAKLAEPEVAVSRLPAEFRIRHLPDVLKLCRFNDCPLTHVIMNVACGFVSAFDTSKVDAEQEFKGVLKQTVQHLKTEISTFKSAAVLVFPSPSQFTRFNNVVNGIIEREVRNLNNYVFDNKTIQFMQLTANEKSEVLAENCSKQLDAFFEK